MRIELTIQELITIVFMARRLVFFEAGAKKQNKFGILLVFFGGGWIQIPATKKKL